MPPTKPKAAIKPFWQTTDGETVRLYHGHVIDVLKQLPSGSIQTCITSPPYFGLRDYKTGNWEGGSPECDHVERYKEEAHRTSTLGPTAAERARGDLSRVLPAENSAFKSTARQFAEQCKKCGATRIDQQLGSEATPEEFIQNMVLVFREVRRVLRDDGVLWLNLGDSFGSKGRLLGVPWRTSLALQEDGWILRSDIPWVKRSCMPESVMNRPNKALEYVFMLVKSEKYFFDMVPIRKDATPAERDGSSGKSGSYGQAIAAGKKVSGNALPGSRMVTGDKRQFRQADLWFQCVDEPHSLVGIEDEIVGIDVTSQGYEGAHFACYPPKLIEPFILSSTSEHGACVKCGAPWKRVTEDAKLTRDRINEFVKRTGEDGTGNSCPNTVAGLRILTIGWKPTCSCGTTQVRPCRVLDTFIGSGTTCAVSVEHGRWSWGIDLSEDYLKDNAITRIEGALLRRPSTAGLTGKGPKKMEMGTAATIK